MSLPAPLSTPDFTDLPDRQSQTLGVDTRWLHPPSGIMAGRDNKHRVIQRRLQGAVALASETLRISPLRSQFNMNVSRR